MDTNVVIDYIGNILPEKADIFIGSLTPIISIVSRMEVMGWYKATPSHLWKLESFISLAHVYNLDEKVVLKTISLR